MMNKHCPITYELISNGSYYSKSGLRKLSPKLKHLKTFAYSAQQQRQQAIQNADKMSIQGVQSKLSAILNVREEMFVETAVNGQFIIKPQSDSYLELPENEALTMSLAEIVGIEVPVHGLMYCIDDSMSYFIKRFDRYGKNNKYAVEDFSQLTEHERETKYDFSMEKLLKVIDQFCTFPMIEKSKLIFRVLFNFIVGNEDMHLKNYSLITRSGKVELAPAYDFINSTIAISSATEEIALSLNGKKNNLRRKDFIEYYAIEKAQLSQMIIDQHLLALIKIQPIWEVMIRSSFLSETMQKNYLQIVTERVQRLTKS